MEGLKSKINDPDFLNLVDNCDLFFACETWAKNRDDFRNSISGYKTYSEVRNFGTDHKGKGHGGLIIYIKNNIYKYTRLVRSNSNNILWLILETGTENILFCITYFSPVNSTSNDAKETLFDTLTEEYISIKNDHNIAQTYIFGDLNCRTGTLLEECVNISYGRDIFIDGISRPERFSKDEIINPRGRDLLSFCSVTDLMIANGRCGSDNGIGEYTCINAHGASVVDYLLIDSNRLSLLSSFDVLDTSTASVHFPISFSFNISPFPINSEPNSDDFPHSASCQSNRIFWKNDAAASFNQKLQSEQTFEMCTDVLNSVVNGNIESAVGKISDIMHFCAADMIRKPSSRKPKSNRYKQPWFDIECEDAKKHMKSNLRRFRANRSKTRLDEYLDSKRAFKDIREQKELIFKDSRVDTLTRTLSSGNHREFWSFFKISSSTPEPISANQWLSYFENLYSELYQNFDIPDRSDIPPPFDENLHIILDSPVDAREILSALKNLNSNKAPGIDGIPIECWKNSPDCVNMLVVIFNAFLSLGFYPEQWKTAVIVPVPKKGDLSDPSNYRGISLLPSLSKVYASVLNARLLKWASSASFFTDAQNGFRAKRSTIDSIFTIHTAVTICQYKKTIVYCAFVDFFKAFDCVPRNLLFYKLLSSGVSQKFISAIKSMYEGIQAAVRCGIRSLTKTFLCPAGVRQGCVLSSTLFISFLNDIEDFFLSNGVGSIRLGVKRLILLLFADDLAILDTSTAGLQRKLNLLSEYCRRWGLTINVKKTKAMKFSIGRLGRNDRWHVDGENLEVVRDFEYLGLKLSCSNSFYQTRQHQISKAKRAMFAIFSHLKSFGRIPRKILLRIFDVKISSILLYGCELWGLGDLTDVESVATKFYRILLRFASKFLD